MLPTNYKKIKIIGFDLDQTLYPKSWEIDLAIRYPLKKAIAEFLNITIVEAENLFDMLHQDGKGLSGRETLIKIGFEPAIAAELIQHALENTDILQILKPDKKTIGLLKKVKEKYQVDLITGSGRKIALQKLCKLQIPQTIFNKIIFDEEASKSNLSAYKLWLSYYPDNKPEDFLYIGDRVSSDYEKPKELNIKSILVNVKEIDKNINCLQLSSLMETKKYLL